MKEARCAGHFRGARMFPGILGSFWDTVCTPNSGQVMAMEGTQPDFQAFFDSFWALCPGHVQDASWTRTHPSYDRDGAYFSGISGQFLGTVCRPCNVQDVAGMQPDFHVFLGSFCSVQAMFGTRLGRRGMQPDF
ncbi:Hypothetical predicted protein [Olea europaea subsp. europaea]|uniref:Uncharacterized protein n=1 Tax=Olea europaea subsp. europaea TaxID=158383 RepID=A0A8S0QMD1_OLEEU|nr:Hypothetical predicted protein [Olea europaea subsp. europaea]